LRGDIGEPVRAKAHLLRIGQQSLEDRIQRGAGCCAARGPIGAVTCASASSAIAAMISSLLRKYR
jgi:hypothetical protein